MSDPVTELEGIVVVGQRRHDNTLSPFPSRPMPDLSPPGQVDELPGEDPSAMDPCADPVKRAEWNMDAAAADAVERFDQEARAAGENGLTYRERAAFLLRMADGTVTVGPTVVGSVFGQPGDPNQPVTILDPPRRLLTCRRS